MHGLALFQPTDLLERKDFWATAAYNIGGHTFTLDDIEHGILRGMCTTRAAYRRPRCVAGYLDTIPIDALEHGRDPAHQLWPTQANLQDMRIALDAGNSVHPATGLKQFVDGDPRLVWSDPTPDPRIHFALNCGAMVCTGLGSGGCLHGEGFYGYIIGDGEKAWELG
jgi:hypothetical protein